MYWEMCIRVASYSCCASRQSPYNKILRWNYFYEESEIWASLGQFGSLELIYFNPIYNCFYFRLVKEANIRFVCTGVGGFGWPVGPPIPLFHWWSNCIWRSLWPQLPPTIVVVLGIQAVERLYVMTGLRNQTLFWPQFQAICHKTCYIFILLQDHPAAVSYGHSLRTGSAAGKNYIVNIKMWSLFHKLFETTTLCRPKCACCALHVKRVPTLRGFWDFKKNRVTQNLH